MIPLRAGLLTVLAAALAAAAALADPPASSLRPVERPGSAVGATDMAVRQALTGGGQVSPQPRPRPVRARAPERVVLATAGTAVRVSIRPDKRPGPRQRAVTQAAVRSQPSTPVVPGPQGALCGDPAIRGQRLSPIPGRLRGCGIAKPVRVTSVDGVALSQPATLNCEAARALKRWVSRSVKPTVGRLGGGVGSLKVVAHYACRTRNNQPGAKLSEHARGNAIDVAAVNLKNGVSLTVLKGWRDPVQSRILKRLHSDACGTFGTVLGPNADRFHKDHFHLDVARYRSGSFCR